MTTFLRRTFLVTSIAALLHVTVVLLGLDAAPRITSVSPRGLRIGHENRLTIRGAGLSADSRLLLPFPTETQTHESDEDAKTVTFSVDIPATIQPGLYVLRVATIQGISGGYPVAIDRLQTVPFQPHVEQLPIAMNGTVATEAIQSTQISGRKGQWFVADVESRRAGSPLEPVLRILDDGGKQLAWSGPQSSLGGDARIAIALPKTGSYTVQLHDVIYRRGSDRTFRLKLGALPIADMAFPLGLQKNQIVSLRFIGSRVDYVRRDFLVPSDAPSIAFAPVPSLASMTGPRPRIVVSEDRQWCEDPLSKRQGAELLQVPLGISGCLSETGQTDRFRFSVPGGKRLRVELTAARLGSPLDGVVTVKDGSGKALATADDGPNSTDPSIEFDVPKDASELEISVHDLLHRGGDRFVYHMAVGPPKRDKAIVSYSKQEIQIPRGGHRVLLLDAQRNNYKGPIGLSVEPTLHGITISGLSIGPNQTKGLLAFGARTLTPPGLVRLRATSPTEPNDVQIRIVHQSANPATRWWDGSDTIGVGVIAESPIAIDWGDPFPPSVAQGSQLPVAIRVDWRNENERKLRVRLLTTQIPPQKEITKDGKKQQIVDDERTIRLMGKTELSNAGKEVPLIISIPVDLAPGDWPVAVRAEVLSSDGKQVEASSDTAVRLISVRKADDQQPDEKDVPIGETSDDDASPSP